MTNLPVINSSHYCVLLLGTGLVLHKEVFGTTSMTNLAVINSSLYCVLLLVPCLFDVVLNDAYLLKCFFNPCNLI